MEQIKKSKRLSACSTSPPAPMLAKASARAWSGSPGKDKGATPRSSSLDSAAQKDSFWKNAVRNPFYRPVKQGL